jgi:thymidylate kinase
VSLLISVWSASPRMGKSTLCEGLVRRLAERGETVEWFREEDVLSQPEFADVAREFAADGRVAPGTLLEASARYARTVEHLGGGRGIAVADALMPYVPTLLAMGLGDAEIDAFMDALGPSLASLTPVLVYLDGDPRVALGRAVEREDAGWLEAYVAKLARYRVEPAVTDVASAVAYLERERAVTMRALRRLGWPTAGTGRAVYHSADWVLEAVLERLDPYLAP